MEVVQLTVICSYLLFAHKILYSCAGEESQCNNLFYQKGGNGSDVVRAVISKIESSNIFNDSDHRFLRRLAYVGTKDGTLYGNLDEMKNGGGIWTFDVHKLESLKRAKDHPKIHKVNVLLEEHLGIEINKMFDDELENVTEPLYCGVATRFYLYYLKHIERKSIPSAIDLTGQAYFWFTHFNITIDRQFCLEEYFKDEVKQLENQEGWWINADIMFVLDLSGSIRLEDFHKMKEFQLAFVEKMKIGRNHSQVGTVIFKDNATSVFNLSTYTEQEELVKAIRNGTSHNKLGLTNIQDALCLLNDSFSEEKGGRPANSAVFRIAFIITDGMSNTHHSSCNWSNISEAANKIQEYLSPILLYAISVGTSVNKEELIAIASPRCYINLSSFDSLGDVQGDTMNYLMQAATIPTEKQEEMNCTLHMNGTFRYNLQIESAIMVNICVSAGGHIEMYGSTSIPNPNSALHEYYLELDYEDYDDDMSEVCGSTVIDFQRKIACGDTAKLQRWSTPHVHKTTVYFSIVSKAEISKFTVTMNDTSVLPPEPKESASRGAQTGDDDDNVIVVASTSSTFLLIASASILVLVICGYVMYHYRKKKKMIQDEDGYNLLPQSPEHGEGADF